MINQRSWALPFRLTGGAPHRQRSPSSAGRRPRGALRWQREGVAALLRWLSQLADRLGQLADEIAGLDVERFLVDTPEAAGRTRFRGSPSIHVNGTDLFADPEAPVGLSCRIYQTPDGAAGSPTIDQLRRALESARLSMTPPGSGCVDRAADE